MNGGLSAVLIRRCVSAELVQVSDTSGLFLVLIQHFDVNVPALGNAARDIVAEADKCAEKRIVKQEAKT